MLLKLNAQMEARYNFELQGERKIHFMVAKFIQNASICSAQEFRCCLKIIVDEGGQ